MSHKYGLGKWGLAQNVGCVLCVQGLNLVQILVYIQYKDRGWGVGGEPMFIAEGGGEKTNMV